MQISGNISATVIERNVVKENFHNQKIMKV